MRDNLGSVLQELEETKEPILVSKGQRGRAVLITPEDFQRRFIDRQAEELRAPHPGDTTTLDVLRELRGAGV
jgi:PHD/YefM family antitoxin component YafN of YafNO toxin-antitoxin module